MTTPYETITQQQCSWAKRRGIQLDKDKDGYTSCLDDNLYVRLSPEARSEFEQGGGGELRKKMKALHSSAALVYNVFEYWRRRSMLPLAKACGAPSTINTLRFEKPYPTGVGPPSQPDVTLCGADTKPFVIESKFRELYDSVENKFSASYFNNPDLWAGIPNCEALARAIKDKEIPFSRLGAAQLLKHILGLMKTFGSNFTLLYLWYEVPSDKAKKHRQEIEAFTQYVKNEVDFRTMTYTELFDRLRNDSDIEERYLTYLAERYFSG